MIITLGIFTDMVGLSDDADLVVIIGMNIPPPYQAV